MTTVMAWSLLLFTAEQSQKQLPHKILYTQVFSAAACNKTFGFFFFVLQNSQKQIGNLPLKQDFLVSPVVRFLAKSHSKGPFLQENRCNLVLGLIKLKSEDSIRSQMFQKGSSVF